MSSAYSYTVFRIDCASGEERRRLLTEPLIADALQPQRVQTLQPAADGGERRRVRRLSVS